MVTLKSQPTFFNFLAYFFLSYIWTKEQNGQAHFNSPIQLYRLLHTLVVQTDGKAQNFLSACCDPSEHFYMKNTVSYCILKDGRKFPFMQGNFLPSQTQLSALITFFRLFLFCFYFLLFCLPFYPLLFPYLFNYSYCRYYNRRPDNQENDI